MSKYSRNKQKDNAPLAGFTVMGDIVAYSSITVGSVYATISTMVGGAI